MKIQVSKATVKDSDDVVAMGRKFFESAGFERIGPFHEPSAIGVILATMQTEDRAIILARDPEGKPLGMAGLVVTPFYFSPQVTFAQELFWWVEPEYRNLGVGRALIDEIEKWAKRRGAKFVSMVALDASEHARVVELYKHRGYKRLETTFLKEV